MKHSTAQSPRRSIRRPLSVVGGIKFLLWSITLSFGAVPLGAADTNPVFPFPFERLDFDNGLRAYLIHAGAPRQIAFVTVVRTGSRDEVEPGRSGFAHFFEHMMFRGTKKHPSYDAVTESIGASHNASTNNDITVYHVIAPNNYLETVVDLEADRFQNLDYSEQGFRTEAGAVLGEYGNSAGSPFAQLDLAIRETAFSTHTYRHRTIGTEADVRAMPDGYEYSKSFYTRFYRPENVVVLLVGDFDNAEAERLLRAHYSSWPTGYQVSAVPTEPEQTAARQKKVVYPGETLPILTLQWKAPAWSPTDRLAIATEVLGAVAFGETSPIYQRLVLNEGRLQELDADFDLQRDPGLLSLSAIVNEPADVAKVRSDLLAEVERVREQGIDADRLATAKQHLRYAFLMGLETARSVAFSLIEPISATGRIEPVEDYYATLAALTADDLREAARRMLDSRRLTEVTMVAASDKNAAGGGQ